MYAERLFVLLFFVLTSSFAHALVFKASHSSTHTVLTYEEDGITTVEEITRASDGWPEIIRHNRFHEARVANEFLRKNYPDRQVGTLSSGHALRASGPALWTVTQKWTWALETELADWIRKDVDKDFFVRHGLATDCADVAYALRWIFARAHGLPMTSRLASGDWMNQNSVRSIWAGLPTAREWYNDKRFLAALDYLLDFTYTHTLLADSYPTAVQLGSIMEGGFHLTTHGDTGHTRPFTNVVRAGETGLPIMVLQSTTPRKVQPLFGDGYWVFELPEKGKAGLLRFRWPDGSGQGLVAPELMPNFSEEQYDPAFITNGEMFFAAVFRHLDPSFTLEKIAFELLKSVQNSVLFRKQVVNDGYAYCSANDCSEGSAAYEAWSTPSRDARLGQMIDQLRAFLNMIPQNLRDQIEQAMKTPLLNQDGSDFSLNAVAWVWSNQVFSVDPRVPPAERWGLSAAGFDAFIQHRSTNLWNEREAFLAKTSSCPAKVCVPDNAAWKARSSRDLDSQLTRLLAAAATYCSEVPAGECVEMRRRFNLPFSLRGPGLSLQQTLESFLRINSDPRHSVQIRRDGFGPAPFYIGQQTGISSTASFLIAGGLDGLRLWDIRKQRTEIPPPAGYAWLSAELTSNRAWFGQKQDLGFRDLISGAEKRFSIPFEFQGVVASTSGSLFVWNSGRWAFVDADGKLVREGTQEVISLLDVDHILVTQNSVSSIFNLGPQDYSVVVTKLNVATLSGSFSSPNKLGWFRYGGKMNLLRRDGEVVEIPGAENMVMTDEDGKTLFVQNPGGGMKYTLDDQGQVISADKLADFRSWYEEATFVSYKENGVTQFVFRSEGNLRTVPLLPGEVSLNGVQGDLVAGRTEDGYFVRRLGDPTPIYRTSGALRLLSGHKGLARVCSRFEGGGLDAFFSLCRMEDVLNPAKFSLYTGIAAYDGWSIMGMATTVNSKVQRGLQLSIGPNTTWVDLP